LVDRLVDDLKDFARPVEPIPVFPGEFFEYSVIDRLETMLPFSDFLMTSLIEFVKHWLDPPDLY